MKIQDKLKGQDKVRVIVKKKVLDKGFILDKLGGGYGSQRKAQGTSKNSN